MAAKAGGSSLHSFANKCSGNPPDNWLNQDARLKPFLLSSLHLPKIIAAHLYVGDRPMIDVIRHASRDSLIIYVYRDETDRLMSAIKFVVKERLCVKGFQFKKAFGSTLPKVFGLNNTEKQCSFDEKPFVEELIEKRVAEVGYSIPMQLTCDLWNEVEETGPTLLFLHYSQLDALQAKLAAHYCPDVQPQRKNVDALKSSKKYTIRLQKGGEVSLDDWIAAKRSTIEFALKLPGGSCKRKTRMMEDALLSSPNKMVQMVSSHQENN